MRFVLVLAGLALLSSAASAQPAPKLNEKLFRAAFEDKLKDADSAKFRAVKYHPADSAGAWSVCGEVNAKNSYGAYQGFQPFLAMAFQEDRQPVQYIVLGIGEASGHVCASKG